MPEIIEHDIVVTLELVVLLPDEVPDLEVRPARPQILELLMGIENDRGIWEPPGKARALRVKHDHEEGFGEKAVAESWRKWIR